ncbi:UDP-2,3-diacylglucosamine diphosphatase LpxI [Caulobacter segnis]|uniref:UDP-2,3-diacylglucosamine diphosphatase n=1 Tax=Caulobacter segnis TaxID=88688 RepID=UPI00240FCC88|nr:UDP-2,3-diacylglucosamine diphosphatase LpxI [Caulobacter segnis]MDG2522033.1 UDP-2,3-diacylglucosamine diphosphatase LpxI [Caulobacter segnis]
MRKLGIIAGGGTLPAEIANHCRSAERPFAVMRLRGFAGPEMRDFPGVDVGLAELGKCIKALKDANCEAVCFAGNVSRPDFSALKPDLRGLAALPGVVAAAKQGDDALLRKILSEFEKEGFVVEGAHEVVAGLTLPVGRLGAHSPSDGDGVDIARALEVAREIGRLDIGQGCVVCRGLVLAVEAQEGTDAMLRRVADLPEAVRGSAEHLRGVLAKAPKPIQETRVDLPTIGVATVQRAARAGLSGIVGEAGRLIVLDREAVIAMADELGLFILGVEPAQP